MIDGLRVTSADFQIEESRLLSTSTHSFSPQALFLKLECVMIPDIARVICMHLGSVTADVSSTNHDYQAAEHFRALGDRIS